MLILLKPTIIIREEQEEKFFGQTNNTPTTANIPNDAGDTIQR